MTRCSARREQVLGWDACILENEFIRLAAVPDIGGRVMAYDLGGYPFFFVDPSLAGKLFTPEENQGDGSLAAWKNYGGDKTWPAPQGWDSDDQWHGPPDPILDTGRYTVDALHADGGSAHLSMTSPPDTRTGIQITRSFTISSGSSRVTVDLSFRNHSDRAVTWSIWDVAQLSAERRNADGSITFEPGCVVTAPVNARSVFARGFNVMFGAEDNPQWRVDSATGLFTAHYQWQIGKVGLDSPAGWVAFSNTAAGYGFAELFAYEPGAEYPDRGASVEVWTVGAGEVGNLNYENSGIYLMETEVLSPLMTIAPGARAEFRIVWGACRTNEVIRACGDAGASTQMLSINPEAKGRVHVQYRGGVFDAGTLSLVWSSQSGEHLAAIPFGDVDPLTVIVLDRLVPRPENAHRLQLKIGQRTLAQLELTE
ncbi:MAG: DUF4380 domain-containing protein [Chloroflexi bacterium]|nr:DUF4380 domain-containing protein [Chloroflexota bacterium]